MRALSILGTLAMFLVGGGIITHNVSAVHHFVEEHAPAAEPFNTLATWLGDALVGVIVGIIVLSIVQLSKKLFSRKK